MGARRSSRTWLRATGVGILLLAASASAVGETYYTFHSPSKRAAVRLAVDTKYGVKVNSTRYQLRVDGVIVRAGELPGVMSDAALLDDGALVAVGGADGSRKGNPMPGRWPELRIVYVGAATDAAPVVVRDEPVTSSLGPDSRPLPHLQSVIADEGLNEFQVRFRAHRSESLLGKRLEVRNFLVRIRGTDGEHETFEDPAPPSEPIRASGRPEPRLIEATRDLPRLFLKSASVSKRDPLPEASAPTAPWLDSRFPELVRQLAPDQPAVVVVAGRFAFCDADRFERHAIEFSSGRGSRGGDAALAADGRHVAVGVAPGHRRAEVVILGPDGTELGRTGVEILGGNTRVAFDGKLVAVADAVRVLLFDSALEPVGYANLANPPVEPSGHREPDSPPLVPSFDSAGRLCVEFGNGDVVTYDLLGVRDGR